MNNKKINNIIKGAIKDTINQHGPLKKIMIGSVIKRIRKRMGKDGMSYMSRPDQRR